MAAENTNPNTPFFIRWWTRFRDEKPGSQALVAIGVIGVLGTSLLVCNGFRQLGMQRDTLDRQITTSQQQTRAYLSAFGLPDSLRFPIEPSRILNFTIRNSGTTPARKVRIVARWEVRDSITNDPATMSMEPLDNGITIGSSVEMSEIAACAGTQASARRSRLFLYGKITYEDVFGDSHLSIFCLDYIFQHQRFFAYAKFNYEN